MSGKLDFDYHEALMVTPSPQLRNRIKNTVEIIWNTFDEEQQTLMHHPVVELGPHAPRPDPPAWRGG